MINDDPEDDYMDVEGVDPCVSLSRKSSLGGTLVGRKDSGHD